MIAFKIRREFICIFLSLTTLIAVSCSLDREQKVTLRNDGSATLEMHQEFWSVLRGFENVDDLNDFGVSEEIRQRIKWAVENDANTKIELQFADISSLLKFYSKENCRLNIKKGKDETYIIDWFLEGDKRFVGNKYAIGLYEKYKRKYKRSPGILTLEVQTEILEVRNSGLISEDGKKATWLFDMAAWKTGTDIKASAVIKGLVEE